MEGVTECKYFRTCKEKNTSLYKFTLVCWHGLAPQPPFALQPAMLITARTKIELNSNFFIITPLL